MTAPRVAWVTGAAGTLGGCVADALVEAGWRVVTTSRRPAPPRGPEHVDAPGDVSDAAGARRAAEAAADAWGRLDAVVCAAGFAEDALLVATGSDVWNRAMDANLKTALHCARAAEGALARSGGGGVVFIGSHAGLAGAAGLSAYASAKAALGGLATSLAREWAERNIRVNLVLPGVFPGGMTDRLTPGQINAFTRANVLARLNDPREAARFIAFLAGMENVSGQCFQLDSRITPWW